MKLLASALALAACSPETGVSPKQTAGTDPTHATVPPGTTTSPPTTPTPTAPAPPVWMSISGGGYHSHTAQAAWTMGMLEASGMDLGDLMGNVRGISSSSGGSWFLAQLIWSESYRDALENDPDGYLTTGYIGQSEPLFGIDDPCASWSGPARTVCDHAVGLQPLFGVLGLPGVQSLDWEAFVREVVFAPFGMKNEIASSTLASPRQSWADGKSIVLGATLLTDEVVLDEQSGFPYDKDEYTAEPTSADVPNPDKFTPAYFADVQDPELVPPAMFGAGELQIDYTTNAVFNPPSISSTFPASPAIASTVIEAAAVSSATGGAAASVQVVDESGYDDLVPLTDIEMAAIAADFAPAFRLGDDGLERFEPTWGIDDNAAQDAVRMCDSGFIDNTGVTFMMRHLADNGLLDDFTLVAFVNTTFPVTQLGAIDVTDNIGFLFGRGSIEPVDGIGQMCSSGFCLPVRVPQIFDAAGLETAQTVWTYSDRGVNLFHHVVDVVTVDNPSLGIEAGHHGTVHFFVSQDEASDVLPLTDDIFATYADVVEVTEDAIVDHGGWAELASALNLD